jgi:hypothetical protein
VRRDTFAPWTQTVEINGGVAPEVDVRLEGGTPTTIVVTDATTGVALSNANVVVESSGKRIAGGMARGDDGTRVWLQPGRYTAMANSYGYSSATAEFTVPGPAVRIALGRAGSLVIVAKNVGTARLRGAVMRMISFSAGVNPSIDNLTPGQYTLEVLDSSRKNVLKSVPVTILAGEKTTATLE